MQVNKGHVGNSHFVLCREIVPLKVENNFISTTTMGK